MTGREEHCPNQTKGTSVIQSSSLPDEHTLITLLKQTCS
ncbi:unnamed protein product [Gulo gulo]|uniref:Uncharacterized protein n=1 Tax=Gulo gulo TaxID=48420 RepID=A0A9X9PTT5_GULGU|nr:unnamed protein product [Gulo gulo]